LISKCNLCDRAKVFDLVTFCVRVWCVCTKKWLELSDPSTESLQPGALLLCMETWHCKHWQNSTDSQCFIFHFGGLGTLFGRL